MGGLTEDEIRGAKMILWRGHCSVHGRFTRESIQEVRTRVPGVQVIVHPECQHEVVVDAVHEYAGHEAVVSGAFERGARKFRIESGGA